MLVLRTGDMIFAFSGGLAPKIWGFFEFWAVRKPSLIDPGGLLMSFRTQPGTKPDAQVGKMVEGRDSGRLEGLEERCQALFGGIDQLSKFFTLISTNFLVRVSGTGRQDMRTPDLELSTTVSLRPICRMHAELAPDEAVSHTLNLTK
jgi:hypothetical protein